MVGAARGLMSLAEPPGQSEAQIHSLVVDSGERGRGIGRLLVRRLEQEAATRGKRRLTLQVVTSNSDAITFYQSMGYQVRPAKQQPWMRRIIGYPTISMARDLDTATVETPI
jgi:ribosomal protein S18 acetylase RimI-like enzyme